MTDLDGKAGVLIQTMRYELKYLVSERQAASIRDFIQGYVDPDQFNDRLEKGYYVCSIYLDNPSLSIYRQTVRGQKNRFKLRARYYNNDPHGPVFLEIKRRENDAVRKSRVAATREGAQLVFRGHRLQPDHLFKPRDNNAAFQTLDAFYRLRDRLMAEPLTFVCYRREAFTSPENNHVRVTFDRNLAAQRFIPGKPLTIPRDFYWPKISGVILELKFTDRFPNWMGELVRAFDLQRVSIPKYVKCVDAISGNQVDQFNSVAI